MQSHATFIVWTSRILLNASQQKRIAAVRYCGPAKLCKLSLLMLRVQWRTSPRKWKFLFPTRGELCCVFWSHTHTGRASAIWHLCLFCFPSVHLSREDRRPCIEKHGLELPGHVPFTWDRLRFISKPHPGVCHERACSYSYCTCIALRNFEVLLWENLKVQAASV